MANPGYSIDTGLPASPEVGDPRLFPEFLRIYNAIKILAQTLDDYTNAGQVANGTFNNLVVAGLVDISGAAAGHIKFPAAQNPSVLPNVLDDYEEGAFTPTISFGGASVGVTYATQSGSYTKIGNRVLFNLYVALTAKGSSVGAMFVGGLPFPVAAGNDFSAIAGRFDVVTSTGQVNFVATAGASTIQILQTTPAGVVSSLSDTNAANTSLFMLSGHYKT